MICGLQIALFVMGIVSMARGRIDLGKKVVGKPMVYLIGLVMMAALGLSLAVGLALGVMEGAQAGGQGNAAPNMQQFAQKYWWVDVSITAGCGLLALILTFASQRPKTDDELSGGRRRRRDRDDDDRDRDDDRRDDDRRRDRDEDDRDRDYRRKYDDR